MENQSVIRNDHKLIDAKPERTHEGLIDLGGFSLRQVRYRVRVLSHFVSHSSTSLRTKSTNCRTRNWKAKTLNSEWVGSFIVKLLVIVIETL